MAKRRIGTRVMVHRRVEYKHAHGEGGGILVNLSLEGCRIKGAPPFPCGTRLRLQLWLPDQSQPVKVDLAAVRWVKENEFGVRFITLLPDAQARLKQACLLLHKRQQPEARVIQLSLFACSGSVQGSARQGVPLGYGKPTDPKAHF